MNNDQLANRIGIIVWEMYRPILEQESGGEAIPSQFVGLVRHVVESVAMLTFGSYEQIYEQLINEDQEDGKRTNQA